MHISFRRESLYGSSQTRKQYICIWLFKQRTLGGLLQAMLYIIAAFQLSGFLEGKANTTLVLKPITTGNSSCIQFMCEAWPVLVLSECPRQHHTVDVFCNRCDVSLTLVLLQNFEPFAHFPSARPSTATPPEGHSQPAGRTFHVTAPKCQHRAPATQNHCG